MKHVIFLVHGTWGRSKDGWYQADREGGIKDTLSDAFQKTSLACADIEYIPFEWEHDNIHEKRLEGAEDLKQKMISLRKDNSEIYFHFIAHSHGGNVVLKAIELYLEDMYSNIVGTIYSYSKSDLTKIFQANSGHGFCFKSDIKAATEIEKQILETMQDVIPEKSNKLINRLFIVMGLKKGIQDLEAQRNVHNKMLKLLMFEQFHRISSVVTMGTPFYLKQWKITTFNKYLNGLIRLVSALVGGFVGAYLAILLGGRLYSLIPYIPFLGLNFINWHWSLQVLQAFLFLAWSRLIYMEFSQREVDTNIYFDEAKLSRLLKSVGTKLFRILSVHASYLDEAYTALKAVPSVKPLMNHAISNFTRPQIWKFKLRSEVAGAPPSLLSLLRKAIRRAFNALVAIFLLVMYPFRYLIYVLANFLVRRQLNSNLSTLAYGLPSAELVDAKTRIVNVLEASYLDSDELDITKHLSEYLDSDKLDDTKHLSDSDVPINIQQEFGRYSFLWDRDTLLSQFQASKIRELSGDRTEWTEDQKKHLLATEERAREFFGVTGLRHSMYYKSPAVILKIAKFIAREGAVREEKINEKK